MCSCYITRSHFGLNYLLHCEAAAAVVQSVSLTDWIRCSVSVVGLVITNCALSTGLLPEVFTAYVVVVPTGILMLFDVCFTAVAARILYNEEITVSV